MNVKGKKGEITSKKTSLDAGKITLVSTFQDSTLPQGYPNTPPGFMKRPAGGRAIGPDQSLSSPKNSK